MGGWKWKSTLDFGLSVASGKTRRELSTNSVVRDSCFSVY